jgi:small conductance mechanosensitive channel
VKEAFDNNGISIPFPQTDMHLHVEDSGKAAGHRGRVGTERRRHGASPRGDQVTVSGDYGADEPRDDDSERG